MRIVGDTNVLVSGLLKPHGPPGAVVDAILAGSVTVLLDSRIQLEYRDVLTRERLRLPSGAVEALPAFISGSGEWIVAHPVGAAFTDPDDRAFYEVARTGSATMLVTGNAHHYPYESLVVTPRQFVDRFVDSGR